MKPEIGQKLRISGMAIEIIADARQKWELSNLTTDARLFLDKEMIEKAIRLGKAEEITEPEA